MLKIKKSRVIKTIPSFNLQPVTPYIYKNNLPIVSYDHLGLKNKSNYGFDLLLYYKNYYQIYHKILSVQK